MKKQLHLFIFVLLAYVPAYSQLFGIKTVGGISPDYATLSAAISALNTNGVGAGGVTFMVAADHYEVASNLIISTTTSNAANPVVFIKNGFGANPRIAAAAGTSTSVDAIIKISGSDYITFDGFTLVDTAINTTTTTRMEWGFAVLKVNTSDACDHVTIKNSNIELIKAYTTTKAVYIANHTTTSTSTLAINNVNGTHRNIYVLNNNLSNTYVGIYQAGYSTANYYDDSLMYDGNIITNFAGTSTTAYGIYSVYYKNITITNDTVSGGTGQTTSIYGIFTTTATGANINISNNFVRLNTSLTTSTQYAIYNAGGANGGTLNMSNNKVDGCTSTTSTSGGFYGIYNSGSVSNANISNNQVTNNTKNATTGLTYYIINSSGTNVKIDNNTVSGNTVTGSTTAVVYCIINSGGTLIDIYKNTVYNNARNTGTTPTFSGIYISSGSQVNVFQNKVYDQSSTSSSPTINGIQIAGGSDIYVHNNLIANLTTTASTINNSVNGINVTASAASTSTFIRNNTIFLNASGASNFGSNGIFVNTGSLVEVSNNLVKNISTSLGTGRTAALRRSSTTIVSLHDSSDNNLLYAGTPSSTNLIYTDGTNNLENINQYQSYLASTGSPRDQFSISENVSFASTIGSNVDFLKPVTITATGAESGARVITGLTGDFLSDNARLSYPQVGQINGGGQMPDIGAYELDLLPQASPNGPAITFKPLKKGELLFNRVLDNVKITHPAGVSNAFGLTPRLYFKKSTNSNTLASSNSSASDGWKYVDVSNFASPYSFTIDYSLLFGALAYGDIIEYFIVAQDASFTPVVRFSGASPAATASSVVLSSAQFPVSSVMNSYSIDTAMAANITVGATGADYTSLTRADGLFNAINNALINSNVTVTLITDIVNENGAVALTEISQDGFGAGTFNVTIKTNAAGRYVSGTYNGGLIQLRNTNNVIFDGEYLGQPYNITYENKSTGTNSVFQIIGTSDQRGSSYIDIKNNNILTGTKTGTSAYGIYIGGTAISTSQTSGGYFTNRIRIINNNIYKAYYGIGINSVALSMADSISIIGNKIGNDTIASSIGAYGLRCMGLINSNIANNKVFNIISNSTAVTTIWGMYFLGGLKNSAIDGNEIDNLIYTATQYNTLRGINITANANANVIVKNNIIKRISGSGADGSVYYGPVGIFLNGAGNNYKFYNNTINLTGNRPTNIWSYVGYSYTYNYNLGNAYTTPIAFYTSTQTGLDVRNNVFSNIQTSTNPSAGWNFAFYTAAPASAFTHLSHNLYYSASATAAISKGFYASGTYTTLNAFKAAFSADKYSIFAKPGFDNDSTFSINLLDSNAWNMKGRGMPLAEAATDIMGNTRSTSLSTGATDLGAYQASGVPFSNPYSAIESAAPAANTTTRYMLGVDTVATISWGPFASTPPNVDIKFYPGVNPTNPPVSSRYMNAKWDITGLPAFGLDYTLRLFYSPAHLGTITSESDIIGAGYAFSAWVDYGSTTSIDTVKRIITISNLSNLAEFTGTDKYAPLPVNMMSFEVAKSMDNVNVIWRTASEANLQNFVIERSYDGKVFSEIGLVTAKNSVNGSLYKFVDANILIDAKSNGHSIIYYRLKSIDYNKQFEYSAVRVIEIEDKKTVVTLNPNPFKSVFTISNIESVQSIDIFDVTGKSVYSEKIEIGRANKDITVTYLKSGIYFLRTTDINGNQNLIKLVKAE